MIRLRKAEGWGTELVVRPPCGHPVIVLPSWISPDGRFVGVLECTAPGCCRKYEDVVLEGWAA